MNQLLTPLEPHSIPAPWCVVSSSVPYAEITTQLGPQTGSPGSGFG